MIDDSMKTQDICEYIIIVIFFEIISTYLALAAYFKNVRMEYDKNMNLCMQNKPLFVLLTLQGL